MPLTQDKEQSLLQSVLVVSQKNLPNIHNNDIIYIVSVREKNWAEFLLQNVYILCISTAYKYNYSQRGTRHWIFVINVRNCHMKICVDY